MLIAEGIDTVLDKSCDHKRAWGSLEFCDMTMPVASCMIVDDVAVKMAVHPWLQKSAVEIKERLSSLSSKTCTLVLTGGVDQVPVALN